MMIALVISLTTGVIAAGAAEARRLSMINDERDVKYFLGVPVVALIPETLTNPERVRAGRQLFKRRLRHLAFAAAAVPLVALLLDATRVFQILGSK